MQNGINFGKKLFPLKTSQTSEKPGFIFWTKKKTYSLYLGRGTYNTSIEIVNMSTTSGKILETTFGKTYSGKVNKYCKVQGQVIAEVKEFL